MDTKTETSAGGVVLATSGNKHFVALAKVKGEKWVLPKGHVQTGETLEQTALREVQEEIGISADQLHILRYIGVFEFNEHDQKYNHLKKNHFFLIRFSGKQLPNLITDDVHAGAAWHSLPLRHCELNYDYQRTLIENISPKDLAGMVEPAPSPE